VTEQEIAENLLYNKFTDNLLYLGSNALLSMNVVLYKYSNDGSNRDYFYREVQYLDKFGNVCRKGTRNIDAFLTISNLTAVGGYKESIIVRGRDLEMLRVFLIPKLETIIQNFQEVFQYRENNKLYVNETIKPISIDMSGNKYLVFKPGVHKLYSEKVIPCMEMYLNSPDNISVLTFQTVYDFMYIIRTFQIQNYASNMLAYYTKNLPMGLNMYDMTSQQFVNDSKKYTCDTEGPLSIQKRDKGFFDKALKEKK
jgi:hypothetical protein